MKMLLKVTKEENKMRRKQNKEARVFEVIGRMVVYGAIWASFVGMLMYGFMNATTLN